MAEQIIDNTEGQPAVAPAVIDSWRDSLPDDLKDNPSLADISDINGLAKQFIDTKAMVGNSFRMPSAEAGEDDINAFNDRVLSNAELGLMRKPNMDNEEAMGELYKTLGRPDEAGGYEAGEGVDPEAFGAMAETALSLGLSKSQFEGIALAQAKIGNEVAQQAIAERDTGLQQLKGEWAGAYDEKIQRATGMVAATKGSEKLMQAISAGQVDADTLRWLDTLATQLGTEGSPMADELSKVTGETLDQLMQKRDEVTKRLLNENLSQTQRDSLQMRSVALSEKILRTKV